MIRTTTQPNLQRFDLQELALSVSLNLEQLTFGEFIEDSRRSELFDVKGYTKAHRWTRVFDPGVPLSYRYVETASSPKVRFCWTVHRNAAGRFLIFRERATRTRVKRDQIEAILDKRAAIAACKLNRDAVDAGREKRAAKKTGGAR
jgi:hypothetical protein